MEKFVEKFLFTAGVKQKYIDTLTSASSISYYTTACTDPSFDENNNYLFFRDLGTLSFYKAIIFYFVDKFPNVTEKTLTLNRNNTTRDSLVGVYMEKFGLGEHILYDPKIKLTEKNYQYIFEAIIGATEFLLDYNYKFGIGNIVIQKICFFYLDQVANLDESKLDNFKTGEIHISRAAIKSICGHLTNPDLKEVSKYIITNLKTCKHIDSAPLDTERHNYEKKLRQGVTKFHYYEFEWNKQSFRLNTEEINGKVEKPYAVNLIIKK